MSARPRCLDVIIVNWNAGALLEACVRSVLDAIPSAAVVDRVVVVDNASSDDSMAFLRSAGAAVTVLRNPANRGFAAACNQGAAGSRADFLLFLNPDTRVSADSLSAPVAYLAGPGHESAGICGVRLVDDRGETMASNRRFPSLRTVVGDITRLSRLWPGLFPPSVLPRIDAGPPAEVDQLIGAFFVVRRRLFEELGGFDERFFVYYEEVDFAWRARQRGHRSVYLAGTTAFHHGGYSSAQVRGRRLFYSLRSRALFARKHWAPGERFMLGLVTVGVELPARLVLAIARLSTADLLGTVEAYARMAAWTASGRRGGA